MKTVKPILFAFVCAFLLLGCNAAKDETKSPTDTIKALNEASKKKDTAAIKNLLSKGTLDLLDQSAKRQQKSVDELLTQEDGAPFQELPEVKNEQIAGETATVEVKNSVTGAFEKIPFTKENGVWKVALDKFMEDAMKRLTEQMKEMPANAATPDGANQNESNKANANAATK